MQRTVDEILDFEREAYDRLWYSKALNESHIFENEKDSREFSNRVKNLRYIYEDLPIEGYGERSEGYWFGFLNALRWIMGDDVHETDEIDF